MTGGDPMTCFGREVAHGCMFIPGSQLGSRVSDLPSGDAYHDDGPKAVVMVVVMVMPSSGVPSA